MKEFVAGVVFAVVVEGVAAVVVLVNKVKEEMK